MKYRALGNTGLEVSEIGFGAEWIGEMEPGELERIVARYEEAGVNIVDCWMADPALRSALGDALAGQRDRWIIQGHIGSTWQDGQYTRSRDLAFVKPAFEDLLTRLRTDHIELGMIHYVDEMDDFDDLMSNGFIDYVRALRRDGTIGHVGFSTHSAVVGKAAVESGEIEMMMFSINPAYDMMPAVSTIETLAGEKGEYDAVAGGVDPQRVELYELCEGRGIGLTVMKGCAGGMLLDTTKSPFGVALSPAQCIHYALTRPAVASIMVGVKDVAQADEALHYEEASPSERRFERVLSKAPLHSHKGHCIYCGHCQPCFAHIDIAYINKLYDLATAGDTIPESVREHYNNLRVNASACIGCCVCQNRCPFGVKIAKRMVATRKLFAN